MKHNFRLILQELCRRGLIFFMSCFANLEAGDASIAIRKEINTVAAKEKNVVYQDVLFMLLSIISLFL